MALPSARTTSTMLGIQQTPLDESALTVAARRTLAANNASVMHARRVFDGQYSFKRRLAVVGRDYGQTETVQVIATLIYFRRLEQYPQWLGLLRHIRYQTGTALTVDATLPDGRNVGHVLFMSERDDQGALSVPNAGEKLRVNYAFRMHGIGTHLYRTAMQCAQRLGITIVPSTTQTDDGRSLWLRIVRDHTSLAERYARRLRLNDITTTATTA